MSSRFTSELWNGIGDIYSAILVHPFLTGLTDGSLPHGTFVSCAAGTEARQLPERVALSLRLSQSTRRAGDHEAGSG